MPLSDDDVRRLPVGIGSEYGFGRRGGYRMTSRRTGHDLLNGSAQVCSGRAALALAIRCAAASGFAKKNGFLLPSYLCHTMVQPFVEAGLKVKFYGVNRSLRVEAETISSQIDSETLGVLLMHYFGFPQNPEIASKMPKKM